MRTSVQIGREQLRDLRTDEIPPGTGPNSEVSPAALATAAQEVTAAVSTRAAVFSSDLTQSIKAATLPRLGNEDGRSPGSGNGPRPGGSADRSGRGGFTR